MSDPRRTCRIPVVICQIVKPERITARSVDISLIDTQINRIAIQHKLGIVAATTNVALSEKNGCKFFSYNNNESNKGYGDSNKKKKQGLAIELFRIVRIRHF